MENNFTAIPNDYINEIVKVPLNGLQCGILRVVERSTLGWQRENHRISYRYISNAMGYKEKADLKQLRIEFNKLVEMKIITIYEKGNNRGTASLIGINLNYHEWIYEGRGGEKAPKKVVKLEIKRKEKGNVLMIEELLSRYNEKELTVVNRFIEIIKSTRVSGKIADSVLLKILTSLDKFPTEYVSFGLDKFNRNEEYHSKKEKYAIGIVRNTFSNKELENKKEQKKTRLESDMEAMRKRRERRENRTS